MTLSEMPGAANSVQVRDHRVVKPNGIRADKRKGPATVRLDAWHAGRVRFDKRTE